MLVWLSAYICNWLAGWLPACLPAIYLSVSSSPSDFLSTVIISPLCNCLVEKVNHGTDVFTHKHIELPVSSYICSQAHIYRKNDLILIMTPEKQDKTLELSKNWSVDSTLERNEVIMKRTYPVKSVKCDKICSNY